ncbi:hypothetical protein E4U58_003885, partial [Claviceps cyperi]
MAASPEEVERRGLLGEALMEMENLRVLLGRAEEVGGLWGRREAFWRFLRRPMALMVGAGDIRESKERSREHDGVGGGGDGGDKDGDGDGDGFLTRSQVDELM